MLGWGCFCSCSIRLPLTLTLAVTDQLHVVGAAAEETHRLIHAIMRTAAIIDQTLVLICNKKREKNKQKTNPHISSGFTPRTTTL